MHGENGKGRGCAKLRGGYEPQGPWGTWPKDCGRFGISDNHECQYPRALFHDWGNGGGFCA